MTINPAQRVYDWERCYVEPYDVSFLSRDDIRSLVTIAAGILSIAVPGVRFVKSAATPCRADPARWQIEIADWGRNRVTILHEMAHLATIRRVAAGEDPHGPSFVAMAIRLYARFLDLDEAHLKSLAIRSGIKVGEVSSGRTSAGRFMEEDF